MGAIRQVVLAVDGHECMATASMEKEGNGTTTWSLLRFEYFVPVWLPSHHGVLSKVNEFEVIVFLVQFAI